MLVVDATSIFCGRAVGKFVVRWGEFLYVGHFCPTNDVREWPNSPAIKSAHIVLVNPIDRWVIGSIIGVPIKQGRLAQLARASRLHREGRGFKSLNAHFENPEELWFLRGFSRF